MNYGLRIFVSIIVVVGLGFWGYGYWLMKEIRSQYAQTIEESLVDFSNVLASYLSAQVEDGRVETKDFAQAFRNFKGIHFSAQIHGVTKGDSPIDAYVTDDLGIVIFDSREQGDVGKDYSQWNDVYLTLKGQYGARSTRTVSNDPLSSVFYVAAPIQHQGKIAGVVSVIKPEKSLQAFIVKGRQKIILMAGIVIIGALVLAALLTWWLTRPIESLLTYARRVTNGESLRPPRTSSNEFNKLGHAFDEMRISLEGKKSVENFVQHLTHELKSPLTAIQGAAELLRDEMPNETREKFLTNIETESQRARTLLEELLAVAALESRSTLKNVESFSVTQLLQDVKSSVAPLLAKKNLQLDLQTGAVDQVVRGERLLIQQAVRNLVQNAIDFSPSGGSIVIAVSGSEDEVQMRVKDQGPGIPDYALAQVFTKFYSLERPDTGKKGSGLGLSFVQEAVFLHGGKAQIEPGTSPYGGANMLISLRK